MEPRSSSTTRHNQLLLKLLLLVFVLFLFFFFVSNSSVKQYQPHGNSHRQGRLSALPFPNIALPTKSGYLPISQLSKSSIFYAFYEAQNPTSPLPQTPIIIWLQGGPGCSSMYGNFLELGPWRVAVNVDHHHGSSNADEAFELEANPGAWNRIFGVLFLDNPIGSGFSVAAEAGDIPRDHMSVAKHLYTAINRFLDLDAMSFRSRPIFIAGESYAGKYVPVIGYYILKKNTDHDVTQKRLINLGGIVIGNGLIDPATQVATHASTAYSTGLISEKQKRELEALQSEVARLVKAERWGEATDARYRVINALREMTGLATLFDYTKKRPYRIQTVTEFLNRGAVKRALRASEALSFGGCSEAVHAALREDTMRSVQYAVEYVARKSRALLYQGMYDLWDGVVSTEAWVMTMAMDSPEGGPGLREAERQVWRDGEGELAGYVQRFGNLSNAVVFGAGHLVPVDQPVNARAMIEDWVLARGLFDDGKDHLAGDLDNNAFLSLFD